MYKKVFFFILIIFVNKLFYNNYYLLSKEKIDINKATLEELESLPGIGEKTAKNIIEYRERFGPFKSIDELEKVKGIGPKKLKILEKYLEVKDSSSFSFSGERVQKSLPIYYYKDERGTIHYTQFPEQVPQKYRNSLRVIK